MTPHERSTGADLRPPSAPARGASDLLEGIEAPCLAVCDWGIGGLDLLHRLMAHRPMSRFLYLSDSGATPYGRLSRSVLHARLSRIVAFLAEQGADEVFVACNAASTVLPVPSDARCPVHGVIEGAVADLRQRHRGDHLGIIGGARTIRSLAYAGPLRADGLRVTQRIAQPLSAAVEAGRLSDPETRATLGRILDPLMRAGVQRLVLACTHYVALSAEIELIWPTVTVYDPISCLVGPPAAMDGAPFPDHAQVRFMTTGSPEAMASGARLAFGYLLPRVLPVPMPL